MSFIPFSLISKARPALVSIVIPLASRFFGNFSEYENLSDLTASNMVKRCSEHTITKNITLMTKKAVELSIAENSTLKVSLEHTKPLVVLLEYMHAKGKHIQKIADIYLDWGFHVLKISLKPQELLFPLKGSQVIAKDLANFLVTNELFSPLVIHGLSVGAYLWGETLVQFKKDLALYQPAVNRIKAQIFDSPADIEAIPTALPAAVFPKSVLVKLAAQLSLWGYLKLFNQKVTKHYIYSRETFASGLVKAPTLFITSNADNLSTAESVTKVYNEILELNLEAKLKIFDGSLHVMHFQKYPREYKQEMETFLRSAGVINSDIQLKAKL